MEKLNIGNRDWEEKNEEIRGKKVRINK